MAKASTSARRRRNWVLAGAGLALFALAAAAGSAYWWFARLTALPDWYAVQDEGAEPEPDAGWVIVPEETESSSDEGSEEPSEERSTKPRKKRAKRATMRGFHKRGIIKDPAVGQAMRASRATFEDGRLEAGVVIDLRRVKLEGMSKKDREFYDRVAGAFPRLAKRDVYVALRDQPLVEEGWLRLGPDPQVVVGKTRYSLRSVAKRLGVSEKKARKELDRAYRRLKLRDPAAGPPPLEDDGLRPEDI